MAHHHLVQAHEGGARLAIGGAGAAKVVQPLEVDADAGRVGFRQHDVRRAGIDDKAHRRAVDLRGQVIVPIAPAGQDDVTLFADGEMLAGAVAGDVLPQADARRGAGKDQPPDRRLLQGLVHIRAAVHEKPARHHRQKNDEIDQMCCVDFGHERAPLDLI